MGFVGLFSNVEADSAALLGRGFHSLVSSGGFRLFGRDDGDHRYLQDGELHVLIKGTALADGSESALAPRDLFEAYRREGAAAFDRLDGTFVIVLWDAACNSLLVCRDDFGAKLLYYETGADGAVYFSDSLHDLLALRGKKELSRPALMEYLRFLDISPPYTIYDGIWFLEPEKMIEAEPGRVTLREKVPRPALDWGVPSSHREVEAQFDELFRKSIRRRIEGAGTVGAFLSGGIDSSLVCSVAAGMRPDVKAFTVGFADPAFDESAVAKGVARHLGVDHEVLVFDQGSDLQTFHEFTSSIPSPFADPAIIPTFQCFRQIAGKVDVVLDGTGADTLIGIMPARHIRFILDYSRHLPQAVRNAAAAALRLSRVGAGYADLFAFEDAAELLIRWKGWSRREIGRILGAETSLDHTMFFTIYRNGVDKTPYELYSMLMGALPDDRLHQSAAMVGQEVAFPFDDSAVRGYVRSLPMNFRYQEGAEKLLFRSLLGKYVPESVWNVPKHGFDFPFAELLRRGNFSLVDRYLSRDALALHNLFDYDMINDVVMRFKAGDLSVRFKVWGLTLFQSWYVNFYRNL